MHTVKHNLTPKILLYPPSTQQHHCCADRRYPQHPSTKRAACASKPTHPIKQQDQLNSTCISQRLAVSMTTRPLRLANKTPSLVLLTYHSVVVQLPRSWLVRTPKPTVRKLRSSTQTPRPANVGINATTHHATPLATVGCSQRDSHRLRRTTAYQSSKSAG